jgi:hypothetical protein
MKDEESMDHFYISEEFATLSSALSAFIVVQIVLVCLYYTTELEEKVFIKRTVFCFFPIILCILAILCKYTGFDNDRRLVQNCISSHRFHKLILFLLLLAVSIATLVFTSIYLFP